MKFYFNVISVFILILYLSCCTSNPTAPVKENKHEIFSGITQTGFETPTPIGLIDTTDWGLDNGWKYFPIYTTFIDSFKSSSFDNTNLVIKPSNFKIYPAYPNPTEYIFKIEFDIPCTSKVFIAIIDEYYNIVKKYYVQILPAGFRYTSYNYFVDKNGNDFPDGIYRCIYRFEDIETGKFGVYEGHGDIQVKKN